MRKPPGRVFVIGAGASKACGLPITSELFKEVFERNDLKDKERLNDLIQYLYPIFNPSWGNYPNLEEFLSLLEVVEKFNETIKKKHKFSTPEITQIKEALLLAVAALLYRDHDSNEVQRMPLFSLGKELRFPDVVVTFNWDLLLEEVLLENGTNWSYSGKKSRLTILKPHGSIDWFDSTKVKLKDDRARALMSDIGVIKVFEDFHFPRIKTPILPVIIPPTVAKEWKYKEFDELWHQVWRSLRYADEIYVIGFSLPPEDLHIRFIMRSAIRANERDRSTPLKFAVVNPDRGAYLRFTHIVQTTIKYYECGLERVPIRELTANTR